MGRRRARSWVPVITAAALLISAGTAGASPRSALPAPEASRSESRALSPLRGVPAGAIDISDAAEVSPRLTEPERVLGEDWATSDDRVWMASGDADGFHVLVGESVDGYELRTIATLARPGFDTDRWIGNACLTQSAQRLVVTYAPRGFTNDDQLFLRGGFTAVVDLTTGAVTDIPVLSTLEYYSPSCGNGENALLTVSGGEELHATRLITLDAATGALSEPVEAEGQITSGVLTPDGIVAAAGPRVVTVAPDGDVQAIAPAAGVPYDLTVDKDGGVVFLDGQGESSTVRRLSASRIAEPAPERAAQAVATGRLTELGLTSTAGGAVMVTGDAKAAARSIPGAIRLVGGDPSAEASASGAVTVTVTEQLTDAVSLDGSVAPTSAATRVDADLHSLVTGRDDSLSVLTGEPDVVEDADGAAGPEAQVAPDAAGAPAASREGVARPGTATAAAVVVPAQGGANPTGGVATVGVATGDPNNPVESERTCAVPRNDPANQALQPKPRQVEWAADQAVQGVLVVARPANWKNLGMPAYTPRDLFTPVDLAGGGSVPAQVLLGILAQESNLWQAPGSTVPGVTGNPLTGNYYGFDFGAADPDDRWTVDWSESDCGYGVAQVTDGMRKGAGDYQTQRAIALDFAANVEAGLRILKQKWNQTRQAGLTINNGNANRIENWFYAIWAYNSGFYPEADRFTDGRTGEWGVGWLNNPANPAYPRNRGMFNEFALDATHPQDWPYPEKVIGFAASPPSYLESPGVMVPAFRAATWNGGEVDSDGNGVADGPQNRREAKPPVMVFCDATNDCQWDSGSHPSPTGYDWGSCKHKNADGDYDGHCWYHRPMTWKPTCTDTCGRGFIRFVAGYAYQTDGTAYPSDCWVPTGALVVDDVPAGTPVVREGCQAPATAGTFTLQFAADSTGHYPSKADFYQLGAGYGGHFWFGHTRNERLRGGSMKVTGTWTLGRTLDQWTRVMVHVPDHGAHTQQATYRVSLGNGQYEDRTILQRTMRNEWVSLGVFHVSGQPSVSLSTETEDGDGPEEGSNELRPQQNEDIAFDAVAFVPLSEKPSHFVVALGDSYSSGEGGSRPGEVDYYPATDSYGNDSLHRNACHRSPYTWSRQVTLPGSSGTVGTRADSMDPSLDYHLLACSGAVVDNVIPSGTGQYGELSQLDRGFLDENTTLVTMSIGGNDSGFADVLSKCIVTGVAGPCKLLLDGLDVMANTVPAKIRGAVHDDIVSLLADIHREAPNAQVVLMGYPALFQNGGCGAGGAFYGDDITWLNELSGVLDDSMADAVSVANEHAAAPFAVFGDPRPQFAGHGICSGDPEYLHNFVKDKTPGEPSGLLPPVSQQSFHPTILGYQAYARALAAALTGSGSISGDVTGPDGAVQQTQVVLTTPGGSQVTATTDASGHYTFDGLVPGTYSVEFRPASGTYARELYNYKSVSETPTPVTLVKDQDVLGVDAELWYASPPQIFSDVTSAHPFVRDIHWMTIRGVEPATPAAPFGSTSAVTREGMAVWLYRLAGSPTYSAPATSPFTDVPTTHRSYKEICWLATRNITTGWLMSDGTYQYRPDLAVERQAMAAFLYRYAGKPSFTLTTGQFSDIHMNDQFYREVMWMVAAGITTGFSDGTFRPTASVERQAMAAFLHRMWRNVLAP